MSYELSSLVNDYLLYLRHEQAASKTTCASYQAGLRFYQSFLNTEGYSKPTIEQFSTTLLRRFLYTLSNKNLRPRTIRAYFHPLRSMGEYAVRNRLLSANPAHEITMPKFDTPVQKTVSNEEVLLLLDGCERLINKRRSVQGKAVLLMLLFSAIRREELCNLRLTDVDTNNGAVTIYRGKGNKGRVVYVGDDCLAALRTWITLRGKLNHDYLFSVDKNRRLHFNGIAKLIEDIKTAAGLAGKPNIKPHALRHWRATDLHDAGVPLKQIQEILGHTRLETTANYLHGSISKLKEVRNTTTLKTETKDTEQKETPKRKRIPLR
jgi:integrase/recombinase XerC